MGRKKKKTIGSEYQKKKYTRARAIVSEKDCLAVLRSPIISPKVINDKSDRYQIINGVVCSTSKYARLYEDYDDK